MKKLYTLALLTLSMGVFSQIKAITEDGKEVVLLENKTWRFVNESDEKTLSEIATNTTDFTKAKDATFLLKSKKVEAGLYFNPKKWKTAPPSSFPTAEYIWQNTVDPNNLMVSMMATENAPIQTLKNLKDIILSTIQSKADFFRLNTSEYRTVNGLKVLYLDYSINTKGMDFRYIGNYYLTEEGYCNIVAFTYEKNFDKNFTEMQSFINGLVKAEKAKTGEIVEKVYTSPPPPMQQKKSK